MARIRKRLNAKRRRTGFVKSKPWTPKPTLAQVMQRMRENMRCDVKSLVPVHDAIATLRENFENIRIPTVFPTRPGLWGKEVREFMESKSSAIRSQQIVISTPSYPRDSIERLYSNEKETGWESITSTVPFAKKLAETLRDFRQQPTDTLVLPPALYDSVANTTTQPVVTFEDGQAITLSVDSSSWGPDETAGMIVRRHPNGDMEILKHFVVARRDTVS